MSSVLWPIGTFWGFMIFGPSHHSLATYGPNFIYSLRPYPATISLFFQFSTSPTPKARWVPNHKWAHLSQFGPPISTIPKMAKRTPGPKLATFNPWPLETTSLSPEIFSLNSGKERSFINVIGTKGFRCGAYMV
ncbi:hypothetical protein O181_014309 [Austropuccinia psidii MF-1]|uniref:Uncharacterized protein n=1 Tax=Austropuccinia psidii MF-1 TaxID=1389203 RepID=A0A9Q3GPQ7_9BASI|nr:hypothetical protein [Austropuccinia psidii MF-1]